MALPVTQAELDARVRPVEIRLDTLEVSHDDVSKRLRGVEDDILSAKTLIKAVLALVAPASLWACYQIVHALTVR